MKNPSTYRRKARKVYLVQAKQRKPKTNKYRNGIRQQLQCLKRNLSYIKILLGLVTDESMALTFSPKMAIFDYSAYLQVAGGNAS